MPSRRRQPGLHEQDLGAMHDILIDPLYYGVVLWPARTRVIAGDSKSTSRTLKLRAAIHVHALDLSVALK